MAHLLAVGVVVAVALVDRSWPEPGPARIDRVVPEVDPSLPDGPPDLPVLLRSCGPHQVPEVDLSLLDGPPEFPALLHSCGPYHSLIGLRRDFDGEIRDTVAWVR